MKKIIKSQKGYSLIIAMGMVALLLIFSSSVSGILIRELRTISNYEDSTQAYYVALAGVERAKHDIANNPQGYNGTERLAQNETDAYATYQIIGSPTPEQARVGNDLIIPLPGSGDVADNCDMVEPPQDGRITLYNGSTPTNQSVEAINHPCNWSKLEYGDDISIPLFAYDPNTNQNISPNGENGFTIDKLELKIRPACKTYRKGANGAFLRDKWGNKICEDSASARYELDLAHGRFPDPDVQGDAYGVVLGTPPEGDTIIDWQIHAEDCPQDNNTCQLLTNRGTSSLDRGMGIFRNLLQKNNSEITERDINIGSQYWEDAWILHFLPGASLSLNHSGISSYLNYTNQTLMNFLANVSSPVLNLKVVQPFYIVSDAFTPKVSPYLEYQIVYQTSNGNSFTIPNNNTIIISEGFKGDFKQTLEVKQSQSSSTLNFAVEN